MTDLSYTPSFVHTDWLGGVDRVEAGGPSGLNARLHAIQSDLRQASTVVAQINTELTQLAPPVGPAQQVAFTPMLGPMAAPDLAWVLDQNGNPDVTAQLSQTFRGLLNVDVPDGSRLVSLRVRVVTVNNGVDDDTEFTVTLSRAPVRLTSPPASAQALVTIDNRGFTQDTTQPVTDSSLAVVDRTNFRYFVTVRFFAQAEIGFDTMTIQSIAINFQPS
jgi:hypothetical protein